MHNIICYEQIELENSNLINTEDAVQFNLDPRIVSQESEGEKNVSLHRQSFSFQSQISTP